MPTLQLACEATDLGDSPRGSSTGQRGSGLLRRRVTRIAAALAVGPPGAAGLWGADELLCEGRAGAVPEDEEGEEDLGSSVVSDPQAVAAARENVRRGTNVFALKTLVGMEKEQPGATAFLASRSGVLLQMSMVASFVILDAARPLMYSLALADVGEGDFEPSAAMFNCVKQALGIVVAAVVALAHRGQAGLQDCLPTLATARLIPVASLYTVANVLSIVALNKLDAATFKLVMQMGLLTTGAFSWAILGKRYSVHQVHALVLTVVAIFSFSLAKARDADEGAARAGTTHQKFVEGLVYALSCALCTSLGSVLSERFLTRDPRPFYAQKIQLEFAGIPCTAAMFIGLPLLGRDSGSSSPFAGWTWLFFVSLLLWVVSGWLTGIVVKHLTSLVKRLLQCCASLLTYAGCVAFGLIPLRALPTLTALMIVLSMASFFNAPPPQKAPTAPAQVS